MQASSVVVEKVPAVKQGEEMGVKGGNGKTLVQIPHQHLSCYALNDLTFPSLGLLICKMGFMPATLQAEMRE